MRVSTTGLAVALALVACSDGSGPPVEGTLVVATITAGDDPDPNGYLLEVDGLISVSLDLTDTIETRLPSGSHSVRLVGVAEQCTVDPGDSLVVEVPPQDSAAVRFEVSCHFGAGAAGFVRITTTTSGPLPDQAGYEVWAEHFGAWDYGGSSILLGTVALNGTIVTKLAASTESGADPYWYGFHLYIPGPCGYLGPEPPNAAPGFTITAGDTLDVSFDVDCSLEPHW